MSRTGAIAIAAELRSHGFQAWLVGGCVRDLILGREPSDYDISTDARPEDLLQLFPRAQLVGAQFGVVLVNGGEIATFRSDHSYADGRHPGRVVFETDPKQDVLRRDFTINALLLDPSVLDSSPSSDSLYSQVVDYVNGLADLREGVVRAIGDPEQRFQEDHLRMLRAVRFAARFRFEIEPATLAAIQKLHARIPRVSPERIRDELVRILTEGGARRGFELLDASGLLAEILPEIAAMKGVRQPPEFHPEGDVWTHTLIMLEGLREPSMTLALGVLLHDIGKPATFRIAERIRFDGHVEKGMEIARSLLTRLRFPHHVIEGALALIANHMKFMEVPRMRESTLKRFMRQPDFEEHMQLHRLDCLSSHGGLENYEFVRKKQQEVPPEQLKPAPLLTGRDLIAAGYRPGPKFGVVLSEIEDAQLEGRISTAAEALEVARKRLG